MHICLHLDYDVISWESNNPSDFVTQSFFGFSVTIRVFRGFDGLSRISGRDEHWTGLGLDWIRTIANFVEFRLDPDSKTLQNLGSGPGPDLGLVNGKEMGHFCWEKAAFF